MPSTTDPVAQHARRKVAAGEVLTEQEARAMADADMARDRQERAEKYRKVARSLDTATEESLLFLTKAFRGAVSMEEPENRVLLGAASSTVGAWSRLQATESARQQTEIVRASIFARDLGGKQTDYIEEIPKPRLKAVGE
jgi:hypothetical protein